MEILTSQLPSGGFGYKFSTVTVKPMTFIEICGYFENVPKDPLEKYLFDIKTLVKDDENIKDCYVMDLDFLIFYKKLITVSSDLSYQVKIPCPYCGSEITKTVNFDKDIHFKQIDPKIMNGARIDLGGHRYDTIVPTTTDFLKVFNNYLRYKTVKDIKMIKTIALIKDFDILGNQVESDILNATHSDITLLLALRELYYDQVEPVEVYCSRCNKGLKKDERRSMAVSIETLIVDFFRDLAINSPINGAKIVFK
jgi:hypothetical protein